MSAEPLRETLAREIVMHNINTQQLHWDLRTNTFTADASDLNLRPGQWPSHIRVLNQRSNGTADFYRTGFDGDAVVYETGANVPIKLTLRVHND